MRLRKYQSLRLRKCLMTASETKEIANFEAKEMPLYEAKEIPKFEAKEMLSLKLRKCQI